MGPKRQRLDARIRTLNSLGMGPGVAAKVGTGSQGDAGLETKGGVASPEMGVARAPTAASGWGLRSAEKEEAGS